jgi:prepilin-type N-terminal cleavage/methylation domain-containing protein
MSIHASVAPAYRPSGHAPRGFTLVELMIMLTIVGLLVAVTLPAFRHFRQSAALPGAIRELSSELKVARQLAISRSHSYAVRIDSAGACYRGFDPTADTVTQWASLPREVRVRRVTAPASAGLFVFDYNGRLESPGRIVLANTAGSLETLNVSLSGRVSTP